MSQPLVKNKAVEDFGLSLPVLDFFILAEVSYALSSSFCSESPFNNIFISSLCTIDLREKQIILIA